jgi:hypothetical protein
VTTSEEIKSYYVNILQREPSDDEVAGWEATVVSGELTIDQVRKAFIDSAEGQEVHSVVRLYQAAFNRVPDASGLKGWVSSDQSIEEIANGFVGSEEFSKLYGSNQPTEEFITSLYYQVLGRAPDAEGLQSWMDSGLSVSQMLVGFCESPEFKERASSAVSTFLDDCGKGTQTYEGPLVENPPRPEPEFTLTGGLQALNDANAAKVAFLVTADGDDDAETSATEDSVEAGLTDAIDNVDDLVDGDYTNASARVKAAMLDDQIDLNDKDLAAAQKLLTEAKAAVAKVEGLTQAISKLDAATKAVETAQTGVDDAEADLAAAEASYQVKSKTDIVIEADGTVEDLIVLKDGKLTLATDVTETTNKGITAVLNASIAKEAADKALTDAEAKEDAAQLAVNDLDLTPEAVTALEAIATAMDLEEGKLPTRVQFESKIASLEAKAVTALATAEETEAGDLRTIANDADVLADAAEADDAAVDTAQDKADLTDAVALRAAANTAATDFQTAVKADQDAADAQSDLDQANTNLSNLEGNIAAFTFGPDEEVTEDAFMSLTLTALNSGLLDIDDKAAIDIAFTSIQGIDGTTTPAAVTAALNALNANNQVDELTTIRNDTKFIADQYDTNALSTAASNADATADAAETDDAAVITAQTQAALTDAVVLRAEATAADTAATNAEKADQDAVDARDAVTEFQGLVDTYNTESEVNPLIAELAPAEAGVEAAQDKIDALTDAVADLKDAQKLVTDLGDLNKAIAAAEDAFTENDLELPVTLDSPTHDATEGSDIFVIGSTDSIITGFGLEGDDMLYVGSKYTLNMGDIEEDGNDSVLEMFLVQNGSDTEVTLEGKVFGSNSSDEEQTITLVGVSVEDVKFDNGLITV